MDSCNDGRSRFSGRRNRNAGDHVKSGQCGHAAARNICGHCMDDGLRQRLGAWRQRTFRNDQYVWAEGAEFGGEAALGIDLQIKKGGGDGSAGSEGEQHDEQPAAVGSEQTPKDAPEHRSIGIAKFSHHSPRKMGAGSMREARRRGMALPRSVTMAAIPITTRKTSRVGSGAAPKILSPSRRAKTMPRA